MLTLLITIAILIAKQYQLHSIISWIYDIGHSYWNREKGVKQPMEQKYVEFVEIEFSFNLFSTMFVKSLWIYCEEVFGLHLFPLWYFLFAPISTFSYFDLLFLYFHLVAGGWFSLPIVCMNLSSVFKGFVKQ